MAKSQTWTAHCRLSVAKLGSSSDDAASLLLYALARSQTFPIPTRALDALRGARDELGAVQSHVSLHTLCQTYHTSDPTTADSSSTNMNAKTALLLLFAGSAAIAAKADYRSCPSKGCPPPTSKANMKISQRCRDGHTKDGKLNEKGFSKCCADECSKTRD